MNENKYIAIGKLIKSRREELNITQSKLASQIGIKAAALSLYESGDRYPDLNRLTLISEKLKIPMAALINIDIPSDDIEIALRAEGITEHGDVQDIKKHIHAIVFMRKFHNNN